MTKETINGIIYRKETKQSDLADFQEVLKSSGFFYDYEIEAAEDFLKYQLEDGDESGVHYFMAEGVNDSTSAKVTTPDGKLVGFICFGHDSCTVSTWLLYWMAVHADYRCKGIGKVLLKKFEEYVVSKGGTKICGETSGRELYKPTRDFYVKNGYALAAEIPDYYSKGDSRVTIVKDLD